MFAVYDAIAESISRAYYDDGELAAIVEFRRHFPLIEDNGHVWTCVRRSPVGDPPRLETMTGQPLANSAFVLHDQS